MPVDFVYVEVVISTDTGGSMSKCLTLGICLVTALLPLSGCGKSEITLRKEAGDADSQFSLGVSYANGEGMRQDDAEAARWYRSAAEQGHADSMVMLGMAYETGTGIAQDNVEAYAWFDAAAISIQNAELRRDRVSTLLSGSQLEMGQQRASELLANYGNEN